MIIARYCTVLLHYATWDDNHAPAASDGAGLFIYVVFDDQSNQDPAFRPAGQALLDLAVEGLGSTEHTVSP